MSSLHFIAANLSRYSLSSSASAVQSFPLSNLQTYYASDKFISSSTAGSQWIGIDFGSAKSCNVLVLDNTNWPNLMSSGSIVLQTSPNNSTWTTVATVASASSQEFFEFTVTSNRYWRILFNGALNEAPYAGNIFLEKKLTPQYGLDWNYKVENSKHDSNEIVVADNRTRTSLRHDNRIYYEIDLPEQNNTFRTDFQTFYQTIRGKALPFYLIDRGNIRYMHLDRDMPDVTAINFGQHKVNSLVMKSQLTGILPTNIPPSPAFAVYEDELIL